MNEDKRARWKGVGMGEYCCSLCCEYGNVREQRCPNCHALMYTQKEYEQMMQDWGLEEELYDPF